ncbi:hypothetical protein OH693_09170 [Escherichia coli]|nr:hypothetical protein [Escherichia coli]
MGLIFFSLPANAGCTLEETARKVIMGFQQEDAQLINSLIDKKRVCMFFSTVVLRWMLKILSKLISGNLFRVFPMALGREHVPRDDEFNKKAIPKFNCERGWNKQGYFISNSDVHHKVSRSLVFTQMFGSPQNTISDAQIAAARVEWNTGPCVWSLRQKSNDGLVFYLSQLYSYDSDWYLTVVDQIGDCGA